MTALFAPRFTREDLFSLYAFNLELARVQHSVREPMMGRIRFQWWRQALADMRAGRAVARHAVAEALADTLRRRPLPWEGLEQLIDSREEEFSAESPADLTTVLASSDRTAGALACLAARLLGGDAEWDGLARLVGRAHGMVASMRIARLRAFHGRVDLPCDRLAAMGLTPKMLLNGKGRDRLAPLVIEIADLARSDLATARQDRQKIAKDLYPAFFVAILADHGLSRLAARKYDPFDPVVLRSSPWLAARLALGYWSGRW